MTAFAQQHLQPGNGPVQISETELISRVKEMAQQIRQDYAGEVPHLVCLLNGAFLFHADLVRALDMPATVDFMQTSSYGASQESSGEVRLIKDLSFPIHERHVILVEDIIDTGLTMDYILRYLQERGPASLKVASLLSKPSQRKVEVAIDYLGFTIPDAYVFGYGLDRDQQDRNMCFISSQR